MKGAFSSMSKYNKMLTRALILSAICEIAGYIILTATDWRIAIGVFLVHYSIGLKKANKQYMEFDL